MGVFKIKKIYIKIWCNSYISDIPCLSKLVLETMMSSTSHEDCETPNNYQPTVPNYPWLIPRYLNGVIGAPLFPFLSVT